MKAVRENTSAEKVKPERVGYPEVAAILGCSEMTAKRLALADPKFPRAFRPSPRMATFDPEAVRAYVALREQEPLDVPSVRAAAEEATSAARKAKRVAAHAEQVRAVVVPKFVPAAKREAR